jgi:hypothetical protein
MFAKRANNREFYKDNPLEKSLTKMTPKSCLTLCAHRLGNFSKRTISIGILAKAKPFNILNIPIPSSPVARGEKAIQKVNQNVS